MKCVRCPWRPRTGGRSDRGRAAGKRWQQTMHGRPAPLARLSDRSTPAFKAMASSALASEDRQTQAAARRSGAAENEAGPDRGPLEDVQGVLLGSVLLRCVTRFLSCLFFLCTLNFSSILTKRNFTATGNPTKGKHCEERKQFSAAAAALLARTSTLGFGLVTLYSVARSIVAAFQGQRSAGDIAK